MGMGRRQHPDRSDDGGVLIGHHPHLFQRDALFGQNARQMVHVRIARAPRKDLVSDHQHGRRGVAHHHLCPVRPKRPHFAPRRKGQRAPLWPKRKGCNI